MDRSHDTSPRPPESSGDADVIRISKEDLQDPHVDDMLARQKSLQGELGITRAASSRWYYRGWFILGLVGCLAALAAWAILEPSMEDRIYFEGVIDNVDEVGPLYRLDIGDYYLELRSPVMTRLEIGDQEVWITEDTRILDATADYPLVELQDLKVGRPLGFYLECTEGSNGEIVGLASYIDAGPRTGARESAEILSERFRRDQLASMLVFPLVAAMIGLGIGCADGLICRAFQRAMLSGLVGLVVGFIGGYICSLLAGCVYSPLNSLAMNGYDPLTRSMTRTGFLVQMGGRALAWSMAGLSMGLGQGIVLRSTRLLGYGLLGGLIGGLIGGLLFDPIDFLIVGKHRTSAEVSRLVGFMVIGLSVGAMIGLVEFLARDAWLQMLKGPLAGKEFLLFRNIMKLGSSPRSEIYLFNDADVLPEHAVIREVGGGYEIRSVQSSNPVRINGHPARQRRLRDGDVISLGSTTFAFRMKAG